MARTLLFINDELIAADKEQVTRVLPYLQDTTDKLTALNIAFDLGTIWDMSLIILRVPKQAETLIKQKVTDIMVDSVANPQIGGLSISKEKLRTMIDEPDCTDLYNSLRALLENSYHSVTRNSAMRYPDYFTITNGTVAKRTELDNEIECRHSYYSENTKQIELFTKISDFVTACNALESYMKSKGINSDDLKHLSQMNIVSRNNSTDSWKPSYQYITQSFGGN